MNVLVPLPVVLPLLGAGLCLVLGRRPRAQRATSTWVLVAVLGVAVALLVGVDRQGTTAVWVGGWPEPLGIALVVDRLSALMLVVSSAVTLGVLLYAVGQGMSDGDEETPVSIFHPTYLVLVAGVANAFLSGDLFNLFVGFEILLAASYVLLTLGGTAERIRAGTTYVVVSLASSVVFLTAIALVYAATGTVNMAQLAQRLPELPDGTQAVLQLMLLIAFGIKAAAFPLSGWLPDSYPTAPAIVTAVFAGLLTKVGVYAILRTQTLLFPDRALTELLLVVAVLTMLVGIFGAMVQGDLKRMLSFTLVSHIGYTVMGVALATGAGVAGAIFYVVHHIVVQTTLFLVAGLVERRTGTTELDRFGGLAWVSPGIAVLFAVPALNLAGIPPFSGFLGKLGLLQAGVAQGSALAHVAVGVGTLTGLLTLYALAKVWNRAFWQTPSLPERVLVGPLGAGSGGGVAGGTDDDADGADGADDPELGPGHRAGRLTDRQVRVPRAMVGVTAALVVGAPAITVVAGPLYAYTERAATAVRDPRTYVVEVLGGGS